MSNLTTEVSYEELVGAWAPLYPRTSSMKAFARFAYVLILTAFCAACRGGDGTFSDGNEVQIMAAAITTPSANPMSATFDLTGVALADDTYQVSLLGSSASLILDLGTNALDGEFSGNFPAGNGTQGGDFVATFVVATPPVTTLDDIQANVVTPSCGFAGCQSGSTSGNLAFGGTPLDQAVIDDIRQWISNGAQH